MAKETKTLRTPAGTVLPLQDLKGKDYLQVAHRMVWFVEENSNYKTSVEFPILTDTRAMAMVTVRVYNEEGVLVRKVTDVKVEDKADFKDFTEKAVTGAFGRCMAQLGYGTAYALADLEEGNRIVDSPMPDVKSEKSLTVESINSKMTETDKPKRFSTFKRDNKESEEVRKWKN